MDKEKSRAKKRRITFKSQDSSLNIQDRRSLYLHQKRPKTRIYKVLTCIRKVPIDKYFRELNFAPCRLREPQPAGRQGRAGPQGSNSRFSSVSAHFKSISRFIALTLILILFYSYPFPLILILPFQCRSYSHSVFPYYYTKTDIDRVTYL